jgi:hypothetical protein
MALVVILVVSAFVLVTVIAGIGSYSASTSTVSTMCIIPVQSGLAVHVADSNGNPISNAKVLLNTTYSCAISNLSGTTDSDGNVGFSVTPNYKYNVTVVPPPNFSGGSIVVSEITAAPPTAFLTTTVTLSGNPVPEFPTILMTLVITVATLAIARLQLRPRKT